MFRLRHGHSATFIVVAAVLAAPAGALAHIDPDPPEAPAASAQSVGFTVEHGCDGSPTVQLDMRLPDAVTDAATEPPPKWTGNVTDNIATFVGGPLAADVAETFRVRMTLPATEGSTLYFPFVQRCENGEIRWIETPEDGSGSDLEQPAPAMLLTAPVAVAPTTASALPAATTVSATTKVTATTTLASSRDVTIAPSTTPTDATASTDPDEPVTSTSAGTADEDGSGTAGTLVFVAAVGAVAAGAAALILGQRRRR